MAVGDNIDVEDIDIDDDVVEDLGEKGKNLSGAELRKLRKQRVESREAKRLARLATRLQARRSDTDVQVVKPSVGQNSANATVNAAPEPASAEKAAAAVAVPAAAVAATAAGADTPTPAVAARAAMRTERTLTAAPPACAPVPSRAGAPSAQRTARARRQAAAEAPQPQASPASSAELGPKEARAARRKRAEARAAARLEARAEARRLRKGGKAPAQAEVAKETNSKAEVSTPLAPTPEEVAARRAEKKARLKAKLEKHKKRMDEKAAKAEAKAAKRAAAEGRRSRSRERNNPKKSKVLKWEVRQTALVRVDGGPSLPLPLRAAAEAAAALQGKNVNCGDSSSSDSNASDAEGAEVSADEAARSQAGSDSEGSDSSSMSALSSSISEMSEASSASSEAMAMAKELAEGAPAACFSWERSLKASDLKPLAEMSLQPSSFGAGGIPPSLLKAGIANPEVETFLLASQVDAEAAARLRALPPHLQQLIMDQGAILKSKNPSSVLSARIRDAEMGRLAPPAPGTANANTGYTPHMLLPCKDKEVEACITKYKLDMRAAGLIRALPHDERRRILDIPLAEARNPSAFIIQQLSNGGTLNANTPFANLEQKEKTNFGGARRGQYVPAANGQL